MLYHTTRIELITNPTRHTCLPQMRIDRRASRQTRKSSRGESRQANELFDSLADYRQSYVDREELAFFFYFSFFLPFPMTNIGDRRVEFPSGEGNIQIPHDRAARKSWAHRGVTGGDDTCNNARIAEIDRRDETAGRSIDRSLARSLAKVQRCPRVSRRRGHRDGVCSTNFSICTTMANDGGSIIRVNMGIRECISRASRASITYCLLRGNDTALDISLRSLAHLGHVRPSCDSDSSALVPEQFQLGAAAEAERAYATFIRDLRPATITSRLQSCVLKGRTLWSFSQRQLCLLFGILLSSFCYFDKDKCVCVCV